MERDVPPPSPDDREPAELLRAARAGSTEAQDALVQLFSAPLSRHVARTVGQRLQRAVSISDLCQEAFVQSLAAVDVLPDDATLDDFKGVLFQHARWVVQKAARKHDRFHGESVLERPLEGAAGPRAADRSSGDVTLQDERQHLDRLVDGLPSDQADVVRRRLAGMDFDAIAADLGIEVEAARKRYLRGSTELRRRLTGHPGE